jgi:hypothetical protein
VTRGRHARSRVACAWCDSRTHGTRNCPAREVVEGVATASDTNESDKSDNYENVTWTLIAQQGGTGSWPGWLVLVSGVIIMVTIVLLLIVWRVGRV